MKKVLALVLACVMVFGLAACGGNTPANNTPANNGNTTPEPTVYNVGMVCIGNNNMAYDRNFFAAEEAAKTQLAAKGINVNWINTYDHKEGDIPKVIDSCKDLAGDQKCIAVFLNSYGMEPALDEVAADYPNTVFVGMTNEGSYKDTLKNTVNAFPSIYEARYLAGVAAGCKLNELIEKKVITADQAKIGYVGAFPYSEVKSGYTAFFLGARSVCPSVTMEVEFINSWGDLELEGTAAQHLIDKGAVLISQHSDSTSPATTAAKNKIKGSDLPVYHVGYNISMINEAPDASIISSRIDWTNYLVYVIETIVAGKEVDQDYIGHGLKDGDVVLTELNAKAAAPGTADARQRMRSRPARCRYSTPASSP